MVLRRISFQRSRRFWACSLLVLALLGAFAVWRAPILRSAGVFLVRQDALEPGAAIASLSGGLPFREQEAARLYREGWAPLVILAPEAYTETVEALRALGIDAPDNIDLRRLVLIKLGVPESAIRITESKAYGTAEEVRAIAAALPEGAAELPVILVTSDYHTRRTGLLWQSAAGNRRAVVRAAPGDPADPAQWWRERRAALAVTHEYLSLLNYLIGLPVRGRP